MIRLMRGLGALSCFLHSFLALCSETVVVSCKVSPLSHKGRNVHGEAEAKLLSWCPLALSLPPQPQTRPCLHRRLFDYNYEDNVPLLFPSSFISRVRVFCVGTVRHTWSEYKRALMKAPEVPRC